ncbi:MAG TPA: class I SAM-dependent methyltransferase [Acidimicrobiales bacterium]|nr:class I SAM-dependent methyltransferase [Acidimicrobiales bacterium]
MSLGGTAAYAGEVDLPPLVDAAVALARALDFPLPCQPGQGRLLAALAGVRCGGVIGETGTGCGVGLAWMVTAAAPDTSFVSVELDVERAAATAALFADLPNVRVLHASAFDLRAHAPFELLVLDGGPGKRADDDPIVPRQWLRPGGTLVLDDFTFGRAVADDPTRRHWFGHDDLQVTEVPVGNGMSTLVGYVTI